MTRAGRKSIELNQPVFSLWRLWRLWLDYWVQGNSAIQAKSAKASTVSNSSSRTLRDSAQARLDKRQRHSYDQTIGIAKHLLSQHWRSL